MYEFRNGKGIRLIVIHTVIIQKKESSAKLESTPII